MKAVIILLSWISIVTYLSLAPIEESMINSFKGKDKLAHFIFYFVMAILALRAFKRPAPLSFAMVFIGVALYGLLMEYLQVEMNLGRHFEINDIIANIIGSLTGSILVYLINRRLN